MPKQAKKSPISGKVNKGFAGAIAGHKHDETVHDRGGDLPPGIIGQFRLVDIGIAQYGKGDYEGEDYFFAQGVVVKPKEHEGIPIEGLQTRIQEPMCDTPNWGGDKSRKTAQEHGAWILNQMRLLGYDTSQLEDDGSNFAEALEQIKETQPLCKFRTWGGEEYTVRNGPDKGKTRKSRVNQTWGGVIDNGEAVYEQDDDMVDTTEDHDEPADEEPPFEAEAEEQEEAEEESGDSVDLEALVAAADEDDGDAQAKLTQMAMEATGLSEDEVGEIETWEEVAALCSGEEEEAEEEAEEESDEEEETFDKGDTVAMEGRDGIMYEVVSSNKNKRTCKLKNLKTKKNLKDMVSWDKLSQA